MQAEFSLYIHVPWCVQKCPYCDFNSHQIRQPLKEKQYLVKLLEDFDDELELQSEYSLTSIFIGGGTPSTLSPGFYMELLDELQRRAGDLSDIEITLEANPGTADAEKFKGYRSAGINRLSLGFQSLSDQQLTGLGRIHSANQAKQAYKIARESGFENINIDLMFGLPGQAVEQAMSDLAGVLELNPEHISWYQLTLEPNTVFFAKPPARMPDAEIIHQVQQAGKNLLNIEGFWQYEISAWSQPDKACKHNLNYWYYGDYLGIGAGAHGKRRLPDGRFRRNSKKRHPDDYLQGNFVSQQHYLNEQDLVAEYFLNRLRLQSDFTLEEFEQRTGVCSESIKPLLNEALEKSLLQSDLSNRQKKYRPSPTGYLFLNDLLEIFV